MSHDNIPNIVIRSSIREQKKWELKRVACVQQRAQYKIQVIYKRQSLHVVCLPRIQKSCCLFTGIQGINLNSLTRHLNSLSEPMLFGAHLGVPSTVINSIQKNNHGGKHSIQYNYIMR